MWKSYRRVKPMRLIIGKRGTKAKNKPTQRRGFQHGESRPTNTYKLDG